MPTLLKITKCTVGQRRRRTAVSHLPTWQPPKQASKATPGLVFYNRHTLTEVYTQFDMGRRNSVPENRDLQRLNFVTRTHCIFGGRWRTHRCEVEDSVMFGFQWWRTALSDTRLDSQWLGALMFSLNGWVNIRNAGDLRRLHAHYDVTVMSTNYRC